MQGHSKETGDSTEETKALIDRYHNLLIEQEKRYALLLSGFRSSVPFLRRYKGKFFYALIIGACIRLLVIMALWLFIITFTGFSGRSFIWMLSSLIVYACLEVLDITSRMKLAREALYE